MQAAALALLAALPAPLLLLACLAASLLACGVAWRARAALLGPPPRPAPRHLRHAHALNEHWRPPRHDLLRRLLFFATARRVTTEFLHPLACATALALAGAALVPRAASARLLAALAALKDDPLVGVAVLGSTILLQDTLRSAVSGLELTTVHQRFDVHDRVQFHASGIPAGVVRSVNTREVVLKCAGGHVYVPASLALSLAVTVFEEAEGGEGGSGSGGGSWGGSVGCAEGSGSGGGDGEGSGSGSGARSAKGAVQRARAVG